MLQHLKPNHEFSKRISSFLVNRKSCPIIKFSIHALKICIITTKHVFFLLLFENIERIKKLECDFENY